jgi:hypothetical protein
VHVGIVQDEEAHAPIASDDRPFHEGDFPIAYSRHEVVRELKLLVPMMFVR